MQRAIHAAIVDDRPAIQSVLRSCLQNMPEIVKLNVYTDIPSLSSDVQRIPLHMIFLELDSKSAYRSIMEKSRISKIIGVADRHDSAADVAQALRHGAVGVIDADADCDVIKTVARQAMAQQIYLTAEVAQALQLLATQVLGTLSARENIFLYYLINNIPEERRAPLATDVTIAICIYNLLDRLHAHR